MIQLTLLCVNVPPSVPRAVHQVAVHAESFLREGKSEAARRLVQETEAGVFRRMLMLSDGAEEAIWANTHRYVVVCNVGNGSRFGLLVDKVDQFGPLDELVDTIPRALRTMTPGFVKAIGRIEEDGQRRDVLLVEIGSLIAEKTAPV